VFFSWNENLAQDLAGLLQEAKVKGDKFQNTLDFMMINTGDKF